MRSQSNYQDLIKLFAICSMVVDHMGLYLFPDQVWMRIVGRMVMPIFAFFAGYNFHGQPKASIFAYGLLLWAMSFILFEQLETANILITIYLGQWYLYIFSRQLKNPSTSYFHIIITSLLYSFTADYIEYGTLVIAGMIIGYTTRHNKTYLNPAVFSVLTLSVFHTLIVFYTINPYLAVALAMFEYGFILFKDFSAPVPLNIGWISRNSLFIYFAHLALIKIVFFLLLLYRYSLF